MKRYQQRRREAAVTAPVTVGRNAGVTVHTWEMCSLAARLGDCRATIEDMRMAEQLLMALVARLPRDGSIEVA
jgi:hypothetical protein